MRLGAASDFTGAEASFRQAVGLAPDEPYPHYELGYTLTLVGRYEEGLEEFRGAYELAGPFLLVETEIWLCEQVLNGSLDEADVGMLRELQWIVDAGGAQSEEALALSERVIDSVPECALAQFHYGKAIIERDRSTAEDALRRCIQLNPDDTTAINAKSHVAILCRKAGRDDEARRIQEEILADYPEHPLTAFAKLA
jgi:Flp pilus assembly protein TadD